MTRFSFTCFIGLTEGFKKEIYVYLTFSKPAYFLVSPKCCPDRPVLNAVLEACSEQRSCLSLGHTNGLSLLKSASQLSSNISEVIQTAKGRTPLIQAIKKLTRESQNIWKSKTTNHESRQHLISRLLSCTCTVLTIFVVIWGVWEAVSYLLQKKSWHSQVCSSSQWNVKPWHPQHILFEAIEQTKTKLQKKRRKLRKRKWGDAGVWGEGMWEQTGWVVALVHEVNSACKRNRIHIPVLAPSPACQGAFMTWADTWNILSSLPKQRMCPVNVSIRRYSAEGGAGRIALPAMTTAWVSSCVSCVLSPASLKG